MMFSGYYRFEMPNGTPCLACFVNDASLQKLTYLPSGIGDFSCTIYYAVRMRVRDVIVVLLYEPCDPNEKLALFRAGKLPKQDPHYMAIAQKGAITLIRSPARRLVSAIVEDHVSVGISLLLFASEDSDAASKR